MSDTPRLDPDKPLFQQKQLLNDLSRMREACEQWLSGFDRLIAATRKAVPCRDHASVGEDPYRLGRSTNDQTEEPTRERRLAQALWRERGWGSYHVADQFFVSAPHPTAIDPTPKSFGAGCLWVAAYQVPLKQDPREPIDTIDLLGVGFDYLPVVGKLKEEASSDTPLWMMAEAISHALSIRRAWKETNFREEWLTRVAKSRSENSVPKMLDNMVAYCVAPSAYWQRVIALDDIHSRVRADPQVWPVFQQLVLRCRSGGFDVEFIAFDVKERGGDLDIENPRFQPLPRG